MKDLGKIIRINLLVLLGYSLLFLLISIGAKSSGTMYQGMDFAIYMMIFIALQVLVNFLLMIVKFVQGEKETALSFLVSFFVVAIVGFSSCLGGASLLGG